nr:MAG TPA: hypothetical protein [Bacteriophage sp.]
MPPCGRRSVLFLPFCGWGELAQPSGRRSVHFSILRVVGTSTARRVAERTSFYHSVGGGLAPPCGRLNVHLFTIL